MTVPMAQVYGESSGSAGDMKKKNSKDAHGPAVHKKKGGGQAPKEPFCFKREGPRWDSKLKD